MPTLGWILETGGHEAPYRSAAAAGRYSGPVKQSFACPFCTGEFYDRDVRDQHISTAHPATTPRLVICGQEMLSERTVYTSFSHSDVLLLDCTHVEVSVDSAPLEPVDIITIPKMLARMKEGRADLRLLNKFAPSSPPIEARFDLRFRVIADREIKKADKLFIKYLAKPNPSVSDVDKFCQSVGHGSINDYADCLADYVLVVLKRDDDREHEHAGRRSFSTLSRLKNFSTPLANLVSSLMRFVSNDFTAVDASRASPALHRAYAAFAGLESEPGKGWDKFEFSPPPLIEGVLQCPIDSSTDAVLRRCDQLSALPRWTSLVEDSLRAEVANPRLFPLDRAKLNALWATNAMRLGAQVAALDPLRALEGNDCFGRWASHWVERLDP